MSRSPLRRLILALYPEDFRARYGDELELVAAECGDGWRVTLDLTVSAVRARLNPGFGVSPLESGPRRLQTTTSTVFALWAWSIVAIGVFSRAVDDQPVPGLRAWGWSAYAVGRGIFQVSLAVIGFIGFLYWLRVVIPAAREKNRTTLLLAFLPGIVVTAWLGCTALLALVIHHVEPASHRHVGGQGPHTVGGWILLIAYGLFTLLCVAVCVASTRRALKAAELPERILRTSSSIAGASTIALAAITTCAAVCLTRVVMIGGLSLRDQLTSVAPVCFLMLATGCAAVSSVRGFAVLRAASGPAGNRG